MTPRLGHFWEFLEDGALCVLVLASSSREKMHSKTSPIGWCTLDVWQRATEFVMLSRNLEHDAWCWSCCLVLWLGGSGGAEALGMQSCASEQHFPRFSALGVPERARCVDLKSGAKSVISCCRRCHSWQAQNSQDTFLAQKAVRSEIYPVSSCQRADLSNE